MPQSQLNDSIQLTSAQTLDTALAVLNSQLDMGVSSYKYEAVDDWRVLIVAAVERESIDGITQRLNGTPSANTVRNHFRDGLLDEKPLAELETDCNAALVAQLPPRIQGQDHKIALDLVLLPYHGEAAEDPDELRRSRAQDGTTYFHCYATAYVIKKNKRVNVAMTYVWASDTHLEVLQRILTRLETIDVGCQELYLDREFYAVNILRFLKQRQEDFTTILPVPVRGERMKRLLTGRKSYQTRYTVRSPKYGSETIDLYIVCRYARGRRGKHGIDYLPYAVIGSWDRSIRRVRTHHSHRGGVETSYRLLNRVRARTSSQDPAFRLLLIAVALTLINVWIYLKWAVVSIPRRGGRLVRHDLFRLDLFRQFLVEAAKNLYGAVTLICRPDPPPSAQSA